MRMHTSDLSATYDSRHLALQNAVNAEVSFIVLSHMNFLHSAHETSSSLISSISGVVFLFVVIVFSEKVRIKARTRAERDDFIVDDAFSMREVHFLVASTTVQRTQ